ncbi:MAG: S1C family serine protease [Myxococcota bacterium]
MVELALIAAAHAGSVTFARLLVEDADGRLLGQAPEAYRTHFLEKMRARGLDARGAEDVLFGRDESATADFLLGGTVTDIDLRFENPVRVEVSVEWKLLDARRDAVVYTVVTRGYAAEATDAADVADDALDDALGRLLDRPKFLAALAAPSAPTALGAASWSAPLGVRACTRATGALPANMRGVLDGVVIVRTTSGLGSGAFVSPDGFVLTAAHVVPEGTTPEVTTHAGLTLPAKVVRVDEGNDVAVLHVPGSGWPCLPTRTEAPAIAEEVYAVGAPAGVEFSVSRGVVSGVRTLDGWRFLQTDAAINPGNSGGPLVDAQGRVVGVVSWKVAAPGFEGLGFGVPMDAVRARLGLTFGESSDTDLAARTGRVGGAQGVAMVTDTPDGPRIASVAASQAATSTRRRRKAESALRTSGGILMGAGAATVLVTWAGTRSAPWVSDLGWGAAVTANTLGWGSVLAGASCYVAAFTLDGTTVAVGPGTVMLAGSF